MAGTAQAFTQADGPGHSYIITWVITTANTDGVPIAIPGASDKTVTLTGTWGGATGAIEGSNDGTTYLALTDPQGNAISKTADGLEAVCENPLWIRPRLSTAGAGATVTVILLCRSTVV